MGRPLTLHRAHPGPTEDTAQAPPILELIPGTSAWHRWQGQQVHYRTMGEGPPLILVHTPDVGACCVEWHRNMEALAGSYTVYAPDLPGFGLSEVHREPYTAERCIRFLADFLHEVAGQPARAIGSVLGGSYLLHVADRWPALVDRLMLVAPAGLSAMRPGPLRSVTYRVLGLPGLSGAVCGSATSRCTILEHLQHDVYLNDTAAGTTTVDARYWVCHRPNAEYVERSRLSGLLNVDIRDALQRVRKPLIGMWGRYAPSPPLTDLEAFGELSPSAHTVVFERSALAPHEEEAGRFNYLALEFMAM